VSRVETIGNATLYLADCRDLLRDQIIPPDIPLIVTDPPYGIGYEVNERKARGGLSWHRRLDTEKKARIVGDNAEFDVEHVLDAGDRIAIFGANHMDLPRGGRWIVWDKRRESTPDDHSDCELVWTNYPGADRIHRQKWRGIVREGEENISRSRKLHPNQKPVALLDFILVQLGGVRGQTVFDPYMGSGSTGIAALRRGMPFIGVEIDPVHFETACQRFREQAATFADHLYTQRMMEFE
jgi:site-specific DNA-methyltransferase (adenine-specific)